MTIQTLNVWKLLFLVMAVFSLVSCSIDPEWADAEMHEKTEQLQEQFTPYIIGTWHIEFVKEKGRFYERLTFNSDGTLSGFREWQSRELVTIGGSEQYTDWQDVSDENGTFSGTWKLAWSREKEDDHGTNWLILTANFDGERSWPSGVAYGLNALFINADETALCIIGGVIRNGEDGATIYTRGEGEPSF